MARKKEQAVKAQVVATTDIESQELGLAPVAPEKGTVAIAVSLPNGIVFNDVPRDGGGVKAVHLPGLNDALRGKSMGILVEAGNALCVNLNAKDWEGIKAVYGRSELLTGVDGNPPVIREMGTVSSFNAAKASGEFKDVSTGLEGADAVGAGVTEQHAN